MLNFLQNVSNMSKRQKWHTFCIYLISYSPYSNIGHILDNFKSQEIGSSNKVHLYISQWLVVAWKGLASTKQYNYHDIIKKLLVLVMITAIDCYLMLSE
jgi:hypothetical protein